MFIISLFMISYCKHMLAFRMKVRDSVTLMEIYYSLLSSRNSGIPSLSSELFRLLLLLLLLLLLRLCASLSFSLI